MSSVSIKSGPRGRTFVRGVIVSDRTAASSVEESLDVIEKRWGAIESVAIHRAAVAAVTLDSDDYNAREFLDLVREKSVLGRLQARRVPFNRRLLRRTGGARGYWVGEGHPVPLSRPALEGSVLMPRKVCALVVTTKESLSPGGLSEDSFHDDLQRAVTDAVDEAFLDVGNAGDGDIRPASITYGATTVASTGDPAVDLANMIAAFEGDLSTAAFVTDPRTATLIALARDAGGSFQFPDIGPRGGSVLGLPVITTRGSPYDSGGGQVALIDASGLASQLDGIAIEKSSVTTLEMADYPQNNSATPTGGSMVSLFQTNSVAFMATLSANWERQRAGGVVVLTGAVY